MKSPAWCAGRVVRRIALDVVGEHDRQSLSGAVAPVGDQSAVLDVLLARVARYGPLQQYPDDPGYESGR